MKRKLATLLYYTGVSWVAFFLSRLFYGRHVRAVNYHGTPASQAAMFERHLHFYSRWYADVRREDLDGLLRESRWTKEKPGILLSFDDGKRNNFDQAKPLLERYGFTGWFFIPAGWIHATPQQQFEAQKADKDLVAGYPNDRLIVNAGEVSDLQQHHVIGCHTMTHHRMAESDSDETLRLEIRDSRELLERITGRNQDVFCWVGGEEVHYTRRAADLIRTSGYGLSFTTNTYPILPGSDPMNLDRSNIETDNSIPLLLFQLSGLMDLLYYPKRKRLARRVFRPQPDKG